MGWGEDGVAWAIMPPGVCGFKVLLARRRYPSRALGRATRLTSCRFTLLPARSIDGAKVSSSPRAEETVTIPLLKPLFPRRAGWTGEAAPSVADFKRSCASLTRRCARSSGDRIPVETEPGKLPCAERGILTVLFDGRCARVKLFIIVVPIHENLKIPTRFAPEKTRACLFSR